MRLCCTAFKQHKKKTENGTKMIGLQKKKEEREKKKKLREVLPVMYSGGHSTIVSSKKKVLKGKKKCEHGELK